MRYKVNAEIKKAKEIFYKNKLSESDCDALRTWQGINEHTSRKTGRSFIKELSLNGVCMTNLTALSNLFILKQWSQFSGTYLWP